VKAAWIEGRARCYDQWVMRATPRNRLLAALLVAALAGSASATPAVIPLKLPSGKVLQTEVMVRDEDRQMGLMFRPSLPLDHGMLFIFEQPDFHAIWMKNCKFPIDIVWLDAQRKVVHVAPKVPPCAAEPCPVYQPLQRASYVVELNAGQASKEKAVVGSRLEFALPAPR
jgi:uncharacterized membrane protein (UPF0127 family)